MAMPFGSMPSAAVLNAIDGGPEFQKASWRITENMKLNISEITIWYLYRATCSKHGIYYV
jgi:hypothetical protein